MREPSIKKRIKTVVVLLLVAGLSARAAWYWRELRRDREITNWLRTHAIRLQTVDPMSDLGDLQALAPVIGDARIAGAGEATHGTREHFLYKHRLLRFLVTQKGFARWPSSHQWQADSDAPAKQSHALHARTAQTARDRRHARPAGP